jgi:Gas vesicle protein
MKAQANQTKAEAILAPANSGEDEASLLDILDHVLNAGIVLHGSLVISVAGVDLVYLGLNAVLTSVETAMKHIERQSVSS